MAIAEHIRKVLKKAGSEGMLKDGRSMIQQARSVAHISYSTLLAIAV